MHHSRHRKRAVRTAVFAASVLTAGMTLFSCGENGLPPWENFPVGQQLTYGVRSEKPLSIQPITEEKAGAAFLDNQYDTFIEGVVTVNNSSYEIPRRLLDELLETMAEYPFETGFYVIDLDTRMSFGLNVDHKYSAASTVKAPYALYLAKQLDAGNVALGDLLEYRPEHHCTGSGSTQYSEYGTIFTLKALFYRMLYNSDNVAYYMLSQYTGVDGFNEMLASMGIESSVTLQEHWCDLTPRDLSKIWSEIWKFRDTGDAGKLLWKYLTTNLYNEFDVAMPEYESRECAHKSGWNHEGYHESGIVRAKRNYICVVMTGTGDKNDCLHRTIRNIDNIMNDYDIWLRNR